MKKITNLLLFLFCANVVVGQWVAQTSNSTNPLSAVDFYDSNNGWIGGFELIYTNDGGNNWLDPVFPAPILFYMNANQTRDIKAFNSLKMIGVGQNNIDNASIIFSTSDGGINWDTLVGMNGYGLNSIDFSTSQKGYICGYYGQFLETLDGGTTWSQVNFLPNTDWYKINFQNQDTAIVVGYNYCMRTYNGGASWSSTPNNLVLYDVMALSNNTCIAIGDDTNNDYALFKSYDFGINWTKIGSIPFDPTYIKRIWAFSEDSILLPSKEIMNSYRNGYWHSYPSTQLINSSNEFEDIDFINGTGYAVGNNGQIYKTTNPFGDEAPYSFFTADTTTICENDSVVFTNNSETGLVYEWYQNGQLVSNSYNTTITFNNPGIDTISLVVDNGSYRDTNRITINVLAKPTINSFSINPVKDSLCVWSFTNIHLQNSQSGISYQFYKNLAPFGNPKNGNGNTLSFSTGTIDSSTNFMVVASASNNCGTRYDTAYTSVYVYPNLDPNTPVIISDSTPCYMQPTYITFSNSDPSIQYNLYYKYDHVQWTNGPISQYGNGGTISFTLGTFASATYQVVVKNSKGCTDTLYQTIHTIVDTAIADFEVTPNSMVGDTIFTTNNSVGGTYNWDFGYNTTPSQSTAQNPYTISDSSYISNPVRLEVTAPYGCKDTLIKLINIFDTITTNYGSYCYIDTLPFHYDKPDKNTHYYNGRIVLDKHTDNRGNTYLCGYFADPSKNGGQWIPDYFISKIDANGNMIWDKYQTKSMYTNQLGLHSSNYKNSIATSITSDCQGNVYVGGQSLCTGMILPDTTFNFQLMYNTTGSLNLSWLLKIDSLGNTEWGRFSYNNSNNNSRPMGISDILYVDDKHIYFYEFSGNGEGLYQIDSDGNIIQNGARKSYLRNSGYSQNMFNVDYSSTGGNIITAPNLFKLSNNDILLAENCPGVKLALTKSPITWLTLNWVYSQYSYNHYVGVIDKDSLTFKSGFITNGTTENNVNGNILTKRSKVDIDEYDNIYVAINYKSQPDLEWFGTEGKKIKLQGGTELSGHHYNTAFIVKYDLQGNLQWYNKLSSSELSDIKVADSSVYLLGNFNDIIGTSSQDGGIKGVQSTGKEMFISSYSLDGNAEWINVIANDKNSFAHAMDITPCGDIYFSGKAESTIYFDGDSVSADSSLFVGKLSLSNNCSSNSCAAFFGGSSCMADSMFCINETIELQWCSYGDNGLLDIYYSLDSGQTFINIVQGYPSINSNFIWSPSLSLFTNQWVMVTIINPNDSSITDTYWTYLDACGVGINENKNNLELKVYPNPSKSVVHFEISQFEKIDNLILEIYDINGKRVLTKLITTNKEVVDVRSFNYGIYYYRLLNENYISTGKIVIN